MKRITYLNSIDGQRHLLLDDLTDEQAWHIVARHGDPAQPFYYLANLIIEEQA